MAFLVWDADQINSEGKTIATNDPAVKREMSWASTVQHCLEFNETRGMEVVSIGFKNGEVETIIWKYDPSKLQTGLKW